MARNAPRGTLTARDLVDLLRARYAVSDGWVLLEQVPSGRHPETGRLEERFADAFAFSTRRRREGRYEVAGFEVKVSRSDWLAELRQPAKSAALRRYCDRWWLVVSDPGIVRHGELPPGWGLLAVHTTELEPGKPLHELRVSVRAPLLAPVTLDGLFVARAMRRLVETYTPHGRLAVATDRGIRRVDAAAEQLLGLLDVRTYEQQAVNLTRRVRARLLGAHREARERVQQVADEVLDLPPVPRWEEDE